MDAQFLKQRQQLYGCDSSHLNALPGVEMLGQ
jgi:hypothetical protein